MNSALPKTAYLDIQTYNPDEVILFPGDPSYLYRVRNGLVRIHTVDDEGTGLTLRYVKPGGFFGEEALYAVKRRYFAEAVTPCELAVLEPAQLERQELNDLNEHLVEVVEHLYRSLYRLSGKRLKARIAAELLDLKDSALASTDDAGDVTVHITHDDLAAAVGSVRETVTKVVGELSRSGAIDAGYGKIKLLDAELLRATADE